MTPRRLRCWAHLLRKAQGLVECYDPDGRAFGQRVRTTLEDLMAAIFAVREGPPDGPPVDLPHAYARQLERLRQAVTARLSHRHDKTQALAVELYNDWEAIFAVLHQPELPLTNHDAERALRHWVIARRLSHGTRTAVGSRTFTLLASVIDTCRQRGHSPWTYLVTAIADRRAGLPLAPLPQPGGVNDYATASTARRPPAVGPPPAGIAPTAGADYLLVTTLTTLAGLLPTTPQAPPQVIESTKIRALWQPHRQLTDPRQSRGLCAREGA